MYPNYGYALHMTMPFLVTLLASIIRNFHILNIYPCCDKLTWDHVTDAFLYKFFFFFLQYVNIGSQHNLIIGAAFDWKGVLLT